MSDNLISLINQKLQLCKISKIHHFILVIFSMKHHLQLTHTIKKSPKSQKFYKTQTLKPFNSHQIHLNQYQSATIDFSLLKNTKSHRSLSSKHQVFKSAKNISTIQKQKSNSFKNLSSHTSQNFNKKLFINQKSKQFTIPTKNLKLQGSKINEKKTIEDIMSRLRNKNSIRIEVRNELIINENKGRKVLCEQNKEPQLNLKELIKDEVSKRMQQQSSNNKQDEQIIKMKQLLEQKQKSLKKIQSQLGSKMNWIETKMEEFKQKETKIKEKQQNILKKEQTILKKQQNVIKKQQQIESNILRRLQEKQRNQQLELQKQFKQKINQIKSQQNHQQISQQNQQNTSSHIQDQLVRNNFTHSQNKGEIFNMLISQPQHIDFNQIQEIPSVNKPNAQALKTNQSQNNQQYQLKQKYTKKQPQIQIKQPKPIPQNQSNTQYSNHNIQDQSIQEIQTHSTKNNENKSNKHQKSLQKSQVKPSLDQSISINKQQQTLKIQEKQTIPKTNKITKQQKIKITQYLKVLNRVVSLLYFMGQIPHHCSSNMKKNKQYQFKIATLYLFKYVYDKFRFIQKVFEGLLAKKAITQQQFTNRVEQNKAMKDTYLKLKGYVYKKKPIPSKQSERFLDEQCLKLCFEEKIFFSQFLFKEMRGIIDFYNKDTNGRWSDHKVNLCYFRMLIAVFIIQEIEFNEILIDPEQNEHPDYMISEIDKFTQSQLKTKMNEAYQLFNDIQFNG